MNNKIIVRVSSESYYLTESCNSGPNDEIQADSNTKRSDVSSTEVEQQKDTTISGSSSSNFCFSTLVCNLVFYLLFRVR